MSWQARGRIAGAALGSAYVLIAGAPHPGPLVTGLRFPRHWVAEVGPDAAASALAGALLWLVALWVAFGLVVTAIALLPGRLGRLASATARRVTPAALRRLVVAAAGTSILLSPVTALAAPAASPTAPPRPPSALPAIGWPTDPGPTNAASSPSDSPAGPSTPPGTGIVPADSTGQVRVQPGDSLWSIAGSRLGTRGSAARIRARMAALVCRQPAGDRLGSEPDPAGHRPAGAPAPVG